mmetsp:Transcript_45453/g.110527  ORF Transcript_45453/g.110527 Transcript_45453/m.110527 type:complete len:342 (-) Transcript_45453:3417-4442(-)
MTRIVKNAMALVVENNLEVLLRHGSRVRSSLLPNKLQQQQQQLAAPPSMPSQAELFVSSSYIKTKRKRSNRSGGVGGVISSSRNANNKNLRRGFCNWIIPGVLMVGQYPGQTPEIDGPTPEDVELHIKTLVANNDGSDKIGITLFCSLQTELPPQNDDKSWKKLNGKVYLEDDYNGSFPYWFSHYKPIVHDATAFAGGGGGGGPAANTVNNHVNKNINIIEFLHHPIEDLSVPQDSSSLHSLLLELLTAIIDDRTIYIHCWGGRGRAGLTASCLLSLIYPELDADSILKWVQTGYDSRLGSSNMPRALSQSPQTESQRHFVRDFVKLVQSTCTNKPKIRDR